MVMVPSMVMRKNFPWNLVFCLLFLSGIFLFGSPAEAATDAVGDGTTIAGEIRDADGHPVAGAIVALGASPFDSTESDDQGAFALTIISFRHP